MKILFVGNLLFKANNIRYIDIFSEKIIEIVTNLCKKHGTEFMCVFGGNILDTYERIHQIPYKRAILLFEQLTKLCKVVVLVGNSDYINNKQFMSDDHWMLPLKYMKNIYIVDKVADSENIIPDSSFKFMFVPYVPVGRFMEALEYSERDWRCNDCIFAHQEFRDCLTDNGEISLRGDKWSSHYPLVVSAHFHTSQRPKSNIVYSGSVLQENFAEEVNKSGVLLIDFEQKGDNKFQNVDINLPSSRTIITRCEHFENAVKKINVKPLETIKMLCVGTEDQYKKIKKSYLYNNLPLFVKVFFKSQTVEKMGDFKNFEKHIMPDVENDDTLKLLLDNINSIQTYNELETLIA